MARRGWWRANAVALIALVVVLPLTVAVTSVNEWSDYYSGRPAQATEVSAGGEASFAGATWGDVRLTRRADGPDLGIPPGTALLVAMIHVEFDPGHPPQGCEVTLRETDGAERQWGEASSDPFDWSTRDGLAGYCASDAPRSYTLEIPFVVPHDATGPFTVDVSVGEELPRFLRFGVDD